MKRIIGFIVVATLFLACEKPPEYSEAPTIYYDNIQKFITPRVNGVSGQDSVVISVRFEDGDGDVGIDQFDSSELPYASAEYGNETIIPADTSVTAPEFEQVGDKVQVIPGSTVITPQDTVYDHVNFYINEFVKRNGVFVQIDLDGTKGGRFEPLLTTGRLGVIDGVIEYSFIWVHADIFNSGEIGIGDSVKFEISVLDRELNRSNSIMTEAISVLVNE